MGLAQHQLLGWVGISDEKNSSIDELIYVLKSNNIPHFILTKDTFIDKVLQEIEHHSIYSLFVLGFSWKLPKILLDVPMWGCWNFHFGKLPEYRGNAPVFWQIKQGEKKAFLTVHKMVEKFDAGAIAYEDSVPILPTDTYNLIEIKLSFLATKALSEMLSYLFNDTLTLIEQDESRAKIYKKPAGNDVCIQWEQQTAQEIRALVNATNAWNNGAYFRLEGQYYRCLQASLLENKRKLQGKAGTVVKADAEGLWVITKDNLILSMEILYGNEGYFTAERWVKMGIKKGMMFH